MTLKSHSQIYETIGCQYAIRRQPDPRIASVINNALGEATSICNVGAGTGSYEPSDRQVVAVEPSMTMIAQRTTAHPVVCATAEHIPFRSGAFDAAMTILSLHHWQDVERGLAEMMRVSRRQVVLTFDPQLVDSFWLARDYLPQIAAFEEDRAPSIEAITDILRSTQISPVLIPNDCTDGFQAAYWCRPESYLRDDVQASISTLTQLPDEIVAAAMDRLRTDLASGAWHKRYGDLLTQESCDFGYRIIIAE